MQPGARSINTTAPRGCDRRTRSGCAACARAVRQQPGRGQTWTAEGQTASAARTPTYAVGGHDRGRARLRAEPAPRSAEVKHDPGWRSDLVDENPESVRSFSYLDRNVLFKRSIADEDGATHCDVLAVVDACHSLGRRGSEPDLHDRFPVYLMLNAGSQDRAVRRDAQMI
jgi:hypothetical protein